MSAFRALDAARAAGIEVRLDGNDLTVSAASEPPTAVIDMLRRHKRSIVTILQGPLLARRQPTQAWDPVDWRGLFHERAGIAEYDGGLLRSEAEARAFNCCIDEWLLRNPVKSSPDQCFECGKSARTDDPLLAIGLAGGAGEAWLHRDCVPAWHAARIAAAVAALSAMNIVAAPPLAPPRKRPPPCLILHREARRLTRCSPSESRFTT
jgi:hypothetical protein